MRHHIFYIFLFSFSFLLAQEKNPEQDSLAIVEKSLYIKDFDNQLNIKLVASNEIRTYNTQVLGSDAVFTPNLGIKYSLEFSYRFLSVSIGIRPRKSDNSIDEKGDSKNKDYSLTFIFDKWFTDLSYYSVEGFYIENNIDISSYNLDQRYIQLPNMKTLFVGGSTAYKVNDNYSIKAIRSQTESQLKSAGSLFPNIDYSYYSYEGMKTLKLNEDVILERSNYSDLSGFSSILNFGYHYTFVYKRWFVNAYVAPGIGFDFYKETQYQNDQKNIINGEDIVFSLKSKLGIGYNTERIYFGAVYSFRYSDKKIESTGLWFQKESHSILTYFGYRFKAPKALTKPVKYIEKKIPVLDEN